LVARRPRPGTEAGEDVALFFGELAVLGVVAFAVYWIVRYHNIILGIAAAPFRAIWGWLT
jgi:hypothetical protein